MTCVKRLIATKIVVSLAKRSFLILKRWWTSDNAANRTHTGYGVTLLLLIYAYSSPMFHCICSHSHACVCVHTHTHTHSQHSSVNQLWCLCVRPLVREMNQTTWSSFGNFCWGKTFLGPLSQKLRLLHWFWETPLTLGTCSTQYKSSNLLSSRRVFASSIPPS